MKTTLISVFASLALVATASAQVYLLQDLGTVGSYNYVRPSGINNSGQVVGTMYEGTRPVAFRHSSGSLQIVASPGPSHSTWGNAINASGMIVGFCDRTGHPSGSVYHAFYQTSGNLPVDFDPNFARNSEAVSVNDGGYVVGEFGSGSFYGHTSGWFSSLDGKLGADFQPEDLNNNRVLVGNSGAWGATMHDTNTNTTTYIGTALLSWTGRARAINDSNTVAGEISGRGFLYSAGAVRYFGSGIAQVHDLNGSGDVVGTTTSGRGFVYFRSKNQFVDVNTLLSPSSAATWTILEAVGINDHGVICGQMRRLATEAEYGTHGMYVYHGFKLVPFLLKPIPFPLPLK